MRKGLRCPKCNTVMKRLKSRFVDPFEVKYYCEECDKTYIFHNWAEYYDACLYEKQKRQKPFNPSIRGSVLEDKTEM